MVKSKANGAFDILGDRDCPPIGTRTRTERNGGKTRRREVEDDEKRESKRGGDRNKRRTRRGGSRRV